MARALFKSWFVDFDPVRAKAEGRDPGLPQPLADPFPARLVDSELGEIPEGWEVKPLSELCSTQYGYTASAVDEPIGPKLLRVTDINKRNWIEWADVPHCAVEPKARASYALGVGDLVVARMADPGKSAIIEDEVDAVFASYLVRLKTTSLAHSYYVYGFLKSDLYAEYAAGAKSGSVQANMNARVIVGASLAVPSTPVVEQFLHAILPLRQRLAASVRESRILAALRDTLLPKLISGELRVQDTERFIRRAV
jgi:type I restriction enzyme S subunit